MLIERLFSAVALAGLMLMIAACDVGTAAPPTAIIGTPTAMLEVPTTGTTPTLENTPTVTVEMPTPRIPEATMPAGTLVVFSTSGGIAGMQKVLTISDAGETITTDRGKQVKTGKLDSKQLSDLKAQLDAASRISLKDRYDNGNVADDIYQKVAFTWNGTMRCVLVAQMGNGGDVPDELQTLITMLTLLATST